MAVFCSCLHCQQSPALFVNPPGKKGQTYGMTQNSFSKGMEGWPTIQQTITIALFCLTLCLLRAQGCLRGWVGGWGVGWRGLINFFSEFDFQTNKVFLTWGWIIEGNTFISFSCWQCLHPERVREQHSVSVKNCIIFTLECKTGYKYPQEHFSGAHRYFYLRIALEFLCAKFLTFL